MRGFLALLWGVTISGSHGGSSPSFPRSPGEYLEAGMLLLLGDEINRPSVALAGGGCVAEVRDTAAGATQGTRWGEFSGVPGDGPRGCSLLAEKGSATGWLRGCSEAALHGSLTPKAHPASDLAAGGCELSTYSRDRAV